MENPRLTSTPPLLLLLPLPLLLLLEPRLPPLALELAL